MTFVADASVLLAALADRGKVAEWAESWIAKGSIAAPELVLVEASNGLRRLELGGRVSVPEATAALRDLLRFPVRLSPFAPFASRIWELRRNLTSYDAWYVALAEQLGCPLVTLDRRLARAPGVRCEVVTLPST